MHLEAFLLSKSLMEMQSNRNAWKAEYTVHFVSSLEMHLSPVSGIET